jgi:hypothetical protein
MGGGPAGTAMCSLGRLREACFKEFTQLRCGPELRDGLQFFECGGKRIRETPDRPRPEFFVLRFEVEIMHGAGECLGASSLPSTNAS